MAWAAPTAAEFKLRFPAFTAVDDALITLIIAESGLMVDESWVSEGDYRLGIMLLTAHTLTIGGYGTGNEAQLIGVRSISSGTFSLTRDGGSSSDGSSFMDSSYGREFAALLRRNKPAILVV